MVRASSNAGSSAAMTEPATASRRLAIELIPLTPSVGATSRVSGNRLWSQPCQAVAAPVIPGDEHSMKQLSSGDQDLLPPGQPRRYRAIAIGANTRMIAP